MQRVLQNRILVNEINTAGEIINDGEQNKSAEPSEGGFPFKPVKSFGNKSGSHLLFFNVIKMPSVNHVQLAINTRLRICLRFKRGIEPHEVERITDPGNAGDEVDPTNKKG